ncbi:MAG TPA: hypothetical protein VFA09_11975 [Ktedonobacteraceae bacterium]|nr:hypothetical protein [Ktedonobacteraceae bacterium]
MSTNDPKQVIIDYLSNTKSRREERGVLAQVETILFLKEKILPNLQAYAVRYMSTTGQQWDEAYCILPASDQDVAGIWPTSSGFRLKTENRLATTEEERGKHGSQPWIKLSGGEVVAGYWFLYGHLIANGYDVAHVRMIPASGPVEEDEVYDGVILLLSPCSPPIEFEFYNPSHTLIGKQLWDVAPL